MTDDRQSTGEKLARLTPEELPRLAEFVAGYLHEDWTLDYESPSEAMYDFLREADLNDVEELAMEWQAFDDAARAAPIDAIRTILHERFRAAWRPESVEEIEAVGEELSRALRD